MNSGNTTHPPNSSSTRCDPEIIHLHCAEPLALQGLSVTAAGAVLHSHTHTGREKAESGAGGRGCLGDAPPPPVAAHPPSPTAWGDALWGAARSLRGTRLHREAPRGPCDGARNWTDGSGLDCWEASDSAGEIGWGGRRLTLNRRAREPASRTSSERLVGAYACRSTRHSYPRRTAQPSGAAKPGEPASLGLSIKLARVGDREEAQKGSSRPKIRHGR